MISNIFELKKDTIKTAIKTKYMINYCILCDNNYVYFSYYHICH